MQTQIELPVRKSNDWIDCPTLRTLLKNNLGLNSRQVSVSKKSSSQYLLVTVRDAAVDVEKVKQFAASFDTWTMDITDYVEGQSIEVRTTQEVDDIHAGPFIEEIRAILPKVALNSGESLSTGAMIWHTDRDFYITRGDKRSTYIWAPDARNGAEYAIKALALWASKI